jgi:hypothetical protein
MSPSAPPVGVEVTDVTVLAPYPLEYAPVLGLVIMFADPLKLIPFIVLVVSRVVAVAEFPVQAEAVAEFPVQAEAVVAVAEFPLQAEAVVAVAAFPVHELDDPLAFPVKLPVTFPKTPPLAVIKPLALIVVKLAEDAVVAPIVALLIVPPEITGLVRVLFVSVSVVALPTRVSVEVGSVMVPVLDIELMIGVVRVLLVSV